MFFFYLLISFLLIFSEYKKYKTLISPVSLATISYLIAVLVALYAKNKFGYYSLSDKLYFFVSLSLIIMWIPSNLLKPATITSIRISKYKLGFSTNLINIILFFITSLFVLEKMRHGRIGSEAFELNYSHGIGAHFIILFSVVISYILCFTKLHFISILLIILGFVFLFLSGTKYHIIFVFTVYILFTLNSGKVKKILKYAIMGILGIFSIFYLNYYIGFALRGTDLKKGFFDFILNHICKYISGGIITLSNVLQGISLDSKGWMDVDIKGIERTNAYSLLGNLIFKYNMFTAFLLILIISFLAYLSFDKLVHSKDYNMKKSYFLFYAFFFGVPLLMSFFNSYYTLLLIYEWGFWSILMFLIEDSVLWNLIFKFDMEKK